MSNTKANNYRRPAIWSVAWRISDHIIDIVDQIDKEHRSLYGNTLLGFSLNLLTLIGYAYRLPISNPKKLKYLEELLMEFSNLSNLLKLLVEKKRLGKGGVVTPIIPVKSYIAILKDLAVFEKEINGWYNCTYNAATSGNTSQKS